MPTINGQFVDKNQYNNPANNQSTIMEAQAGGASGSYGDSYDPNAILKAQFAAQMAANPKNYTALKAIYEMMAKPEETTDERKRRLAKQDAEKIISGLEDFYLKNKLHYGSNSKGIWKEMISGSSMLSNQNDPAYRYKALLNSARPFLVAAAGDVGNKGWQEQVQAGKPFPTLRVSKNTAIDNFSEIRKKFGLPERDYNSIDSGLGGTSASVNNLSVKALGTQFGGN